jgi:hypothetical protein
MQWNNLIIASFGPDIAIVGWRGAGVYDHSAATQFKGSSGLKNVIKIHFRL